VERSEEEESQDQSRADTDEAIALAPAGEGGPSSKGDDSLTPPLRRASADDGAPEPASTGSALRVPSLDLPKPSTDQRRTNGARTLSLASRALEVELVHLGLPRTCDGFTVALTCGLVGRPCTCFSSQATSRTTCSDVCLMRLDRNAEHRQVS